MSDQCDSGRECNRFLGNQQTMGSNCARTIDVAHDTERRPTTTETRVAYDNSTWHAMNTTCINSTKETSLAVGNRLRVADVSLAALAKVRDIPLLHHNGKTTKTSRTLVELVSAARSALRLSGLVACPIPYQSCQDNCYPTSST